MSTSKRTDACWYYLFKLSDDWKDDYGHRGLVERLQGLVC